jgi:ATP-dependent Clp protease ATP-binding subunit ClpB
VFHPLGLENIKAIAKIQLQGLRQRLLEKGFTLSISGEALNQIASVGFDPVYGARPLKRAIQHELENPLASQLLSLTDKHLDTVQVDVLDGRLTIEFTNAV